MVASVLEAEWNARLHAYTQIQEEVQKQQEQEQRRLTALEQQGLNQFRAGDSQCTNCHNGAEITAAGWSVVQRRAGNIGVAANLGFFRIGVRPIVEDVGLGGNDDFGLPLFSAAPASAAGTFKAPALRNVAFRGPSFPHGSQATWDPRPDV